MFWILMFYDCLGWLRMIWLAIGQYDICIYIWIGLIPVVDNRWQCGSGIFSDTTDNLSVVSSACCFLWTFFVLELGARAWQTKQTDRQTRNAAYYDGRTITLLLCHLLYKTADVLWSGSGWDSDVAGDHCAGNSAHHVTSQSPVRWWASWQFIHKTHSSTVVNIASVLLVLPILLVLPENCDTCIEYWYI